MTHGMPRRVRMYQKSRTSTPTIVDEDGDEDAVVAMAASAALGEEIVRRWNRVSEEEKPATGDRPPA